jgi:hypothetical protein
MAAHMGRLELSCKLVNISIPYRTGAIVWPESNSELRFVDEAEGRIGYYMAWCTNVDPDGIRDNRTLLLERQASFMLAMQYIGNISISKSMDSMCYVNDAGKRNPISHDFDIEAIIRRSRGETFNYGTFLIPPLQCSGVGHSSEVPLPKRMPIVPLNLKRHILTVVQAEELDRESEHYEDEQLKRWFLIIEELEINVYSQDYKDVRSARNFVSHPTSNAPDTIAFLKRELPSSVYINMRGTEEARYLRDNPTHRAVVSKYQTIARRWARELVEKEITSNGGYIEP